jgi:DNA repair exonuclease SbcCD ATPase subunit
LRPDGPLNGREFHGETIGHLDRAISVAIDPDRVFELHRQALDRIVEKFDPHRTSLFRVKSGWDGVISDLQSCVALFARASGTPPAAVLCVQQAPHGGQDRVQRKRSELNDAITKLRELVPSLTDEIIELKAALVGMKHTIAEQSAAAEAQRQSFEQAKDLLEHLRARLSRNRRKREAAAEELTATREKWDAARSELLRKLESVCAMGKAIEAKKTAIAGLRKREAQFIVVRTTGVEEQGRKLREDIAEIRSETESIETDIALLERVIAAEAVCLPT